MSDHITEDFRNLAFFRELITCVHPIHSWTYGSDGSLLDTNSDEMEYHRLFKDSGCLSYAVEHFEDHDTPVFLSTLLGLVWGAAVETNGEMRRIHVIGPALNTNLSLHTMESAAKRLKKITGVETDYVELLKGLPVISHVMFQHYLIMLCYCVTGERMNISDIEYQQRQEFDGAVSKTQEPASHDRHQTYMAERALLYCVREGDLNYQSALSRAASLSSGIRIETERPITQAILSTAGFATLCTRAAIEGGLSPDTAYTVGDGYIQNMLSCKTVAEVAAISHAMYEDFIRRMHKTRENKNLSKHIRKCVEYIQLHPEEELNISRLAKLSGYTDYYLSRKFKQEVGESVSDYINYVRIERAKMLLETTDLSISEIAETLRYCSSAYFGDVFKEIVGALPKQYRREKHI